MIQTVVIAPTLAGRAGLRALLNVDVGVQVVYEASSPDALPASLGSVDVFVLMTGRNELDLLADRLPVEAPFPAVLLLTDSPEDGEALLSLPLRAWGLLPADCSEEALLTAVYAVDLGLVVADAAQMQPLLAAPQNRSADAADVTLTERELEVLTLLADGLANKQISVVLKISEHTVKFHVSSIYTKLNVSNRAEAVRQGIQLGWIMI